MDNYVEQIISKKAEGRDTAVRMLILIGFSFVAALSIVCTLIFYFPFLLVIGMGAVYLMWYLLGNTSIEYEYIVTNNEFDIDKIIGRRKRKRLITIKLNTTEEWGEYKNQAGEKASATVSAHDCRYKNIWYIVANHEKHGKTLLLFSPNDDVLVAVNKSVPYNLRKKEVKEIEENKIIQELKDEETQEPDSIEKNSAFIKTNENEENK